MIQANRKKLSAAEMNQALKQITAVAHDNNEDELVAASAIRTMGNMALTMRELGQISDAESKKESAFLLSAAKDAKRASHFRTSAITTLGILKSSEATPMLLELLAESQSMNVAELSRPACLALMRIEGERAAPTLRNVLAKTTDAHVFGTAALALGQLKNRESLKALIENSNRFTDSGSCDAALGEMSDLVKGILRNPGDEGLEAAVRATRYLWREGEREAYTPLLRGLLTKAPLAVRKMAIARLLESASTLEFEKEKQELALVLPALSKQPELAEFAERIESRLAARLVQPIAGGMPTSVLMIPKGGIQP